MRKILFFTYILLFVNLVTAQDTMYIMQDGTATEFPIESVDSLIFYNPNEGGTVNVSSVSLNSTTASLSISETLQLTATVSPTNATNKSVSWESNNNGVATVSTNGLVTAVAEGTATITVTTLDGSFTATSNITVTGTTPVACLNTNGDFSSDMEGWATYTNKDATFDASSGELTVTGIASGASDWEVAAILNYTFTAGLTYTISFDARSNAERTIGIAIRKCIEGDCDATYYANRQKVINSTTATYSLEFTYDGVGDNSQVMFQFGESNKPVYLDNVCISEGSQITPNGTSLKILPIGDSITQGSQYGTGTYRKMLYYELTALGYNVDMVGTMETMAASTPFDGTTDPKDPSWDQNHEAYWGNRTDQLLTYLKTNLSSISAPDIATIHLGTNNLNFPSPFQDLRDIISELRTKNPNITIFLAQLIDSSITGYPSNIDTFNSQIPGIASEMNTAQSPVIVVNQHTTLTAGSSEDYVSDNLHPTFGGAAKMAKVWIDAILANL